MNFGDGYVDLGAQYCQGKTGNVVYELAKDLNLLIEAKFENELFLSNGRKIDPKFNKQLHEVIFSVFYSDTSAAGSLNAKDFYIARYEKIEQGTTPPNYLSITLLSEK